ncbi:unnamed protein product [Cylindrotheca closterium]|uniref:Cyclin-F n=1 Tax=Cylindrotheca closterium TaxID=2856 RepID=A0AAD2CQF4_9STRA|nr:unnamed protein product [Cylindrotheca closterium]
MKRQLCITSELPEPRRRKRSARMHPASVVDISSLSPDVLHTILSFLVSESGCVDCESLKSASLVCKKWREVSLSRSLWSIPTNLQGNGVHKKDSINISLSIWDSSPYDGRIGGQSLMGFIKICHLESSKESDATRFLAKEKATGKDCILSIAKSKQKSSNMIKEVFRGHQVEQRHFLCPHLESFDRNVPRGIRLLNDRVVRWYENNTVHPVTPPATSNPRCDADFQRNDDSPMSQMFKLQSTMGEQNPSRQRLRSDSWAMIVDWIAEVAECFDLDDETIFRTMDLVDRVVTASKYTMKKQYYQLVAAACLQIASKCSSKEISGSNICMCSDNSFTVAVLARTEEYVLTKLGWKLAFPSSLDFLNQLRVILDLDKDSRMFQVMRYVSELALQTKLYVHFEPSMVAATAVVLSNYSLDNQELWSDELEGHTTYSLEDLAECTIAMSRLLQDVRHRYPNLIIIDQRYRKASRGCVAEISIPIIPSFASLVSYQQTRSRQNPDAVSP